MKTSDKLQGYELLDASCGERLERWGNLYVVRPDPQVMWKTPKVSPFWGKLSAKYNRSKTGGGSWEFFKTLDVKQVVEYANLKFWVKPMNFKHMGIFPEQVANWEIIKKLIESEKRTLKVLNLFGYTGCASLVAASSGAEVCHVDAAKGMVSWGRENTELSSMSNLPIRWIVDDCVKFVKREIRRGNKYDAVILDPPSYGKGPNGEIWRLEDNVYDFLKLITEILSDNFSFVMFNLYAGGLAAGVADYLMRLTIGTKFNISLNTDEIGIVVQSSGQVLPCGVVCIVRNNM